MILNNLAFPDWISVLCNSAILSFVLCENLEETAPGKYVESQVDHTICKKDPCQKEQQLLSLAVAEWIKSC